MAIMLYGIPDCERAVAEAAKRMAACGCLVVGVLIAASPAAARDMTVYPECGSPPAHWVADGAALNEHQMFHEITLQGDGLVRWNGQRTSDERLKSNLRKLGVDRFRQANQVGLVVDEGVSCSREAAVRAMMETALDCGIGMCRMGTLSKPPPPSPAR